MSVETVEVPDVGSSDPVDVIEVPVKEGDSIAAEDTLIVVESDKATVEVPAPFAGVIRKILIKQGDRVTEGDPLMEVERADESGSGEDEDEADQADSREADTKAEETGKSSSEEQDGEKQAPSGGKSRGETATVPVKVPDLGDIDDAELIEFSVSEGDEVAEEDNIAVLESDKATVEIPSPQAGKVTRLIASIGDKMSTGDVLMEMQVSGGGEQTGDTQDETPEKTQQQKPKAEPESARQQAGGKSESQKPERAAPSVDEGEPSGKVHAGPAVRKLARKMGVDLAQVTGSGPAGRILKEDVQDHVKKLLTGGGAGSAAGTASAGVELPEIDFSKWGEIEEIERSKLRKVSATNLHRSWVTIPHVTQHDEADVTDLEAFRKSLNPELEKEGAKLTMLAFLVQACARTLRAFPDVNASLSNDGETLIRKHYINIGIAVDTPRGLVVPVLRDADKKGLVEIAKELGELSKKARDRKLSPKDMQGGTFSISSLGGIGGTAFTPVVNWPEVGILGVSRMDTRPVWNGETFEPRLMLPLSFSYDHRVVDGADAARFTSYLSRILTDMRRALL